MKFKFYTLVLCCCFALGSYAQSSEKIVFKAGKNGYASYRIPSIIKTPNGDLLAFAEG